MEDQIKNLKESLQKSELQNKALQRNQESLSQIMQNMSTKEKELKLDNNEQRIQILDLEEQIEKLKKEKEYEQSNMHEFND